MRASHVSVVLYGIFIGAVAVGFNYAGVTVGWLLSFLGIIVDPICRKYAYFFFTNFSYGNSWNVLEEDE